MRSAHRDSSKRRSRYRHRLLAAIVVHVGLVTMMLHGTALAAPAVFYLGGDGVPTATLRAAAPTAGVLPNYDPGRDGFPGLMLSKSSEGLDETDPTKHQLWVGSPTGIDLDGPASLTFWSAMKDFDPDKKGSVRAYLLDCTPEGGSCDLIDSGSITIDPWSGGSDGWVSHTIGFGSVVHSVPSGRSLAVKVVVRHNSGDDMWFAYDTTSYPSRLTLELAPPPTTTTTTTTTTTAPPTTTTTTTTAPPTTTTTAPPTTTPPPPTTIPAAIPPDPPAADPPTRPPGDGGDRLIQALPEIDQVETSEHRGLSGRLIDGAELVIPPQVATALVSPLLIVEAFVAAFTESGRALLVPGMLLLLGVAWVMNESKLVALFGLVGRRRREKADQ